MSFENAVVMNTDPNNPIIKVIDFAICHYFPNHETNGYPLDTFQGKDSYLCAEMMACYGLEHGPEYDASKAEIW